MHKARAQFLTSYKKRRVRGRKVGAGKGRKEGEKEGRGGEEGARKQGGRGKYLLNAQVNVGSARGRQNYYALCRFLGHNKRE